jgi:type I restriction enzyme S subunit
MSSFSISLNHINECIVTYLDGLQAKVNTLRESQSATGEELSVLLPSVLDRAFKGEL